MIVMLALVGTALGCGACGAERARYWSHMPIEPPESAAVERTVPVEPAVPVVAAPRDLGTLPAELAELAWPAPPRITREVEVTSAAEMQAAVDVDGTRVRVRGAIPERVTVHGSDIEIVGDAQSSVARLGLDSAHRVRITGGEYGVIELQPPARWNPDPRYDIALLSTDVMIERVRVVADDTAFLVRGRRVAVIDSDVTAERYSLWAGDTGPLDGEDLIVAGNTFRSAGPEATVRIHDVIRSVVVDNVLSNTAKHNYRVHGRSDRAFAARNLLLGTGVMIGTQPGDRVGTIIFVDNVLHHLSPSLFQLELSAIARLVCRGNVAYSDRPHAFYAYSEVPAGWEVAGNQRLPYRPYEPPATASSH